MEKDEPKTAKIQIQRIYTKEISCKIPQAPNFFLNMEKDWQPNFSLEVHVKHQSLPESQHEVTVHAIVLVKTKENVTALTIDLQQSGIFTLAGFTAEQLPSILTNGCLVYLYPYLCHAVSAASVSAGFPPIVLAPLNFEMKSKEENQSGVEEQKDLVNKLEVVH